MPARVPFYGQWATGSRRAHAHDGCCRDLRCEKSCGSRDFHRCDRLRTTKGRECHNHEIPGLERGRQLPAWARLSTTTPQIPQEESHLASQLS